MKSKYPLLAASVIYTAVILYFSSLPAGISGPAGFSPGGEAVHFVAYAVYAAVLLTTVSRFSLPKPTAISLAIAAALGAMTEAIQLLVPGRVCSPVDWLVDVTGAVAGLGIILLLSRSEAALL